MHSTINYFIYITCAEITKVLQTCRSKLVDSLTDPFTKLLLFDWITYIEYWASTYISLFSHPRALSWVPLSNLIYNFLLLFIGNLKIDSTWIDWLSIKDRNNYLPNNLASQINSTSLHCWIVDSSLFSDWFTRSWLIQTLTESAESQVRICEWLTFPTLLCYHLDLVLVRGLQAGSENLQLAGMIYPNLVNHTMGYTA